MSQDNPNDINPMTIIPPTTHPLLQAERDKCSFDKEYLTNILDGGDFLTQMRREAEALVTSLQEIKQTPKYHFLSREEAYTDSVRKAALFIRLLKPGSWWASPEAYFMGRFIFPNELNPLTLQNAMVCPMIESQGDEEQKKQWLPEMEEYKVFMTYVQTELGHGTNIRGLETTATYDPRTQHFDLHSPTLTSTKWWPGGLGKTVDHAIVMARLLIGGADRGVHAFVVPLRDTQTHRVLPGLTIGDIGPKFGFESVDNGFLRFHHYQLPRRNMLMGHAQVHPDGTYTTNVTKKSSKLSYGSMVLVRSMLVYEGACSLAQAVTIATRYSCIRRQSEYEPGKEEPQIIVYQAQQQQLFCQLAAAYCFLVAGFKLRQAYFNVRYDVMRGNLETLPELHASSAGLKALTLDEAQEGIGVCRLLCGGHGYSSASNFPKLFTQTAAACTYEGIHPVLNLQTARYLVKVYKDSASSSSSPESSTAYITTRRGKAGKFTFPFLHHDLVSMFELRHISKATSKLDDWLEVGRPYHEAWNLASLDLIKAAQAHTHVFLVSCFNDKLQQVKEERRCVYGVMSALYELYALKTLVQHAADFVEACGVTFEQLDSCRRRIEELLVEIRPQAVSLVDAFEFPDLLLDSCLGRFDGRVYEALYDWASKSPLNHSEVHPSIKHLKPQVTDLKAKL